MGRRPTPNRDTHRDETRPIPEPPAGLGADGLAAWNWVWSPQHTWITSRHLGLVERYCQLRDVAALTLKHIREHGIMATGSQKQERTNPALIQLKNLATELRLCETEMGLTPAAESKTVAPGPAPTVTAQRAKGDRPGDATLVTLLSDHRKRNVFGS